MQTIASLASHIICWERETLPKGGYRLDNIRQVSEQPDLTGYRDCTHLQLFQDELACVLAKLELAEGMWLGARKVIGDTAYIVAMLVA